MLFLAFENTVTIADSLDCTFMEVGSILVSAFFLLFLYLSHTVAAEADRWHLNSSGEGECGHTREMYFYLCTLHSQHDATYKEF